MTLIERMAEAIYERFETYPPYALLQMNGLLAADLARAALEAAREPTGQMLKASCGAMSPSKRPTPERVSSKEKHRIRYQAMIDSELKRQTFTEAVKQPFDPRPCA